MDDAPSIDSLTSKAWEMYDLLGVSATEHKSQFRDAKTRAHNLQETYGVAIKVALKFWGQSVQTEIALHPNKDARCAELMEQVLGCTWPERQILPLGDILIFELSFARIIAAMTKVG